MGLKKKIFNNTSKPQGFLGKMMVASMNSGHAKVSDWGLTHLPENLKPENIIDLGCGGGVTANKLMKMYPHSELTALDYSDVSVEKARIANRDEIALGRCTVIQGNVAELPMMDNYFSLATAFETVYFWPGPEKSFSEVYRVLKDDGVFMIVNESDGTKESDQKWVTLIDGMSMYDDKQLEEKLRRVGFREVSIFHEETNKWLCLVARK